MAGQNKERNKKMQRILYVEDDLSLIDGLQYTLEISGYTVDNAKTKKEALRQHRTENCVQKMSLRGKIKT